jgi:hypothetical protein
MAQTFTPFAHIGRNVSRSNRGRTQNRQIKADAHIYTQAGLGWRQND